MREMKDSGVPWIGVIPVGWKRDKVIRLFKFIGSGTTPKSSDEDSFEGSINWIQSGDINGGVINACKKRVSEDALLTYSALKLYRAPFIVIAMYGASVGNTCVSLIDGCVNQACCVLKDSVMDEQYAFSVFKALKGYLLYLALGGGQTNISIETIKSSWLPFPPLEEQHRIATFLDIKCSEIDSIIIRSKASIDEYKKLKQSIITEAVTNGVHGDRPLKDSGVDWIGKIPTDWSCKRIKHCFSLRDERNTQPMEDVTLLSLYTEIGVFPHGEREERGNKAVTVDGYKIVHKDDIVVNIILAWMGAIGISEYDGVTSPAYDVWMQKDNSIYARYGYKFKREDLLDYFSQYSWYNPITNDMGAIYNKMNDNEKYNIEFIKKHE